MNVRINTSKEDFIEHLRRFTKDANLYVYATPLALFYSKSSPFIGLITENKFRITRLDDWTPYSWYLKGTISDNRGNVELTLKTRILPFPLVFGTLVICAMIFALVAVSLSHPESRIVMIPLIFVIVALVAGWEFYYRRALIRYFIELCEKQVTITNKR